MLTEQEKDQIRHEMAHYEDPRAASIEALKIVQKRHGWVSDEQLKAAAELLGMSAEQLDSVATFYNLIYRRPVGRHVIKLCDSVACHIMGYDRLRERLQQKLGIGLGQTTADNRFTLLPIPCLGTCDHAPAMLVGDDLHRDLEDVSKVDAVLEQYR
ncbi:MAG TPA: NADH-quinone oxidoreductase subunit NuoE [Nevskiales bacterium]|nr:NADH-quinone oxidoreductase subunit NuoE [Nevskiales bacterium]